MASTDGSQGTPRTRDELLADVRRRGTRIRRRRQIVITMVLALGASVPAAALMTMAGDGGRGVRMDVAGPTSVPPAASPAPAPEGQQQMSTTAPGATPTTAEVHGRIGAINGSSAPRGASRPPADDPVVQPAPPDGPGRAAQSTTTTAPSTATPAAPAGTPAGPAASTPTASGRAAPAAVGPVGSATASGSTAPVTAPPGPALPTCPANEVSVTVTTDQARYETGTWVTGSTSIVNRSASTCLLAARETVHIEDASGRIVSNFAYTMEYREPVQAEPGRALTGTFTWDQRDCSGPVCVPVPAGTYTAVAAWTSNVVYGPARAAIFVGT